MSDKDAKTADTRPSHLTGVNKNIAEQTIMSESVGTEGEDSDESNSNDSSKV